MRTIKYYILTILYFLFFQLQAFSTEQVPDYLWFKGQKISLSTGWGHPSPLETYFTQTNTRNPFRMISTANYRGFIANWVIKDKRLFLKSVKSIFDSNTHKYITIQGKKINNHFDIKSNETKYNDDNKIFADWFTGVIECTKDNTSYYFLIKSGVVEDSEIITSIEQEKLYKHKNINNLNKKQLHQLQILELNDDYIAFYFNLNNKDSVVIDGRSSFFSDKFEYSPVFSLYKNKISDWPFHWLNRERNGAPICKWSIEDDKVYLKHVDLTEGTQIFTTDKKPINLSEVFPYEITENKIFAKKLNGYFVIEQGNDVEDEFIPNYSIYKNEKIIYVRIENGIIKERFDIILKEMNFQKPSKLDPGFKRFLEKMNQGFSMVLISILLENDSKFELEQKEKEKELNIISLASFFFLGFPFLVKHSLSKLNLFRGRRFKRTSSKRSHNNP